MHCTLASAYIEGLQIVLERGTPVPSVRDPLSPASAFGTSDRPYREVLGHHFTIEHPIESIIVAEARSTPLAYCAGLALWCLAGDDSVSRLAYYNRRAREFADAEDHLCGAFGKRLFCFDDVLNQIQVAIDRIRTDPYSRRAICLILEPEDNERPTREFPCAIGQQFFLRDSRLHAITYMRAQQALTLLPVDGFLFTVIQCYVASALGIDVGTYSHFSGTFHVYDNEISACQTLIKNGAQASCLGDPTRFAMDLPKLLHAESLLRAFGEGQSETAPVIVKENPFVKGTLSHSLLTILQVLSLMRRGLDERARIAAQSLPGDLSNVLVSQLKASMGMR